VSDQQQNTREAEVAELKKSLRGCAIIVMLLLAGLVALMLPAVQEAREAARRMQCVPDMVVKAAIWNYVDKHGSFPPAYSTDAEGKPLHSWRVLILLDGGYDIGELANIRLDEPWDSPHNSQFHDKMPPWHGFYCPSRPEAERKQCLTPYQMVIGPDTISNGPNSTKLSDITRDRGDVLLIVETSVPVPWMKPVDLPQSALLNGVVSSVPKRGQPVVQGIGSPHYNGRGAFTAGIVGANVGMADGSCRFLTADISPERLLEMSRIREPNGEEGEND